MLEYKNLTYLSEVMVALGDRAYHVAKGYNQDVVRYGEYSNEVQINAFRLREIQACVRCHDGFDLVILRAYNYNHKRMIVQLNITYNEEPLGLPWNVPTSDQED